MYAVNGVGGDCLRRSGVLDFLRSQVIGSAVHARLPAPACGVTFGTFTAIPMARAPMKTRTQSRANAVRAELPISAPD
jgi:hypothetical protein